MSLVLQLVPPDVSKMIKFKWTNFDFPLTALPRASTYVAVGYLGLCEAGREREIGEGEKEGEGRKAGEGGETEIEFPTS